jgi:hypothetical protein
VENKSWKILPTPVNKCGSSILQPNRKKEGAAKAVWRKYRQGKALLSAH